MLRKSRDLVGQSSDQIDKGVSILAAALEGSPRKDVLLTEIAEAKERLWQGDGPESLKTLGEQALEATTKYVHQHHVAWRAIDAAVTRVIEGEILH